MTEQPPEIIPSNQSEAPASELPQIKKKRPWIALALACESQSVLETAHKIAFATETTFVGAPS
jgi:hypothetical protein